MTSPDSCKTVRIVTPITKGNPNGFVEINETDFNEAEHELFETDFNEAEHELFEGEFIEPVAEEEISVDDPLIDPEEEISVDDPLIDPEEDADNSKVWGAPSAE